MVCAASWRSTTRPCALIIDDNDNSSNDNNDNSSTINSNSNSNSSTNNDKFKGPLIVSLHVLI